MPDTLTSGITAYSCTSFTVVLYLFHEFTLPPFIGRFFCALPLLQKSFMYHLLSLLRRRIRTESPPAYAISPKCKIWAYFHIELFTRPPRCWTKFAFRNVEGFSFFLDINNMTVKQSDCFIQKRNVLWRHLSEYS